MDTCFRLLLHIKVCLEFYVSLENFSFMWTRHHYLWRTAYFDLLPLNGEGSFACYTYCDTRHQFIIIYWSSLKTRDTHTCCRAFRSGAVITCSNNLGLSRPEHARQTLYLPTEPKLALHVDIDNFCFHISWRWRKFKMNGY